MKARYRLVRRGERGCCFYCVDSHSKKRTSLQTGDEAVTRQLVEAKNIAERQPSLNRQIAKAYLAGTDSGVTTRTWSQALADLIATKRGANQKRWKTLSRNKALSRLQSTVIVETRADMILHALNEGSVSTNVFLRRLLNFCLDMGWLPWPILPKRQWPTVRFKEKRAITFEEHQRIVSRERNPERKAFYQLAWHLGASQSDLANLQAEDADREHRVITIQRQKTAWRGGPPAQIRFGDEVEQLLESLPRTGPLFPYLRNVREADRATQFRQRCAARQCSNVPDYRLFLRMRFLIRFQIPASPGASSFG